MAPSFLGLINLSAKISRYSRRLFGKLRSLYSDRAFIRNAYKTILQRDPDRGGFNHYYENLQRGGMSRKRIVEILVGSDEFRNMEVKYDYHKLFSDYITVLGNEGFKQYVDSNAYCGGAKLCELVNPAKWTDPEWMRFLEEMRHEPTDPAKMHRKGYEWAQAIYGLSKLGKLEGAKCLGVGTGHEPIIYWLANNTHHVTATDLFDKSSYWAKGNAREADPSIINNPEAFAPFPYAKERLKVMRMNGLKLEFADNEFDVVFSLSSIEHFGGHRQSAIAMQEIARVLKPDGVAAIATELILNDSNHSEYFTLSDLIEFVVKPAGMPLVQLPVFELPGCVLENPTVIPDEKHFRPQIILKENGVVFTSVMLFFKKSSAKNPALKTTR
jgi:SAM-dependent methyltransferase